MNFIGVLSIILGLANLIYGFKYRRKVAYYGKQKVRDILIPNEYFKLQFAFSMLSSILLILLGVLVVILNANSLIIVASPLIFHLANATMLAISPKKYIK